MSYQYIEFDGASLPLFNHSQEHATMPAEATLLDSIGGGVYDWMGTERRRGRKQIISLTGVYMGQETFFSDDGTESGSGDALIWGDAYESIQASVSGLMTKRGRRGQLWRKRLNDDALEWKTARLLQVSWPRKWEDHSILAEMSCRFETAMDGWRAETETERTKALASDGFGYNWIVEVDTELTIDDAVITIAYGSGTLTAAYIYCPDLGVDIELTGLSVTSGSLIIDCGAQTVRNSAGTDIYSYFDLGTEHTARGWCPLPGGNHQFNAKVVGGTATATIAFYSQTA